MSSAESKSSTKLLKISPGVKPMDYSRVPTKGELGDALLNAAARGDHKKLKKICQTGVNVDYRSESGHTALFAACLESHKEAVELLLMEGANPNQRGNDGRTPIHAAAFAASVRIIRLLVDTGGDLRLHDREGRSARDWVESLSDSRKKRKMLKYLEQAKLTAINISSKDVSMEHSLHANTSRRNLSLSQLIRRRTTKSVNRVASSQHHGFGKVHQANQDFVGATAMVPLFDESLLKYDAMGYSYDNGPFMQMDSMLWNKVKVSVKRLHRDFRPGSNVDMLIAESDYMSRLHHPNILLLMGLCQTDLLEGLVLIYERVAYGSLYSFVHLQMESLEVVSVCSIIRQVADALVYIHQQNLLHCAVTSHAIQLVSLNSVRLANFEYMVENVTQEGVATFSLVLENKYSNALYNWLAPEVLGGQSPTVYSDLYSLTAVLWELLNETPPWAGMTADEISTQVVDQEKSLSSVPSRPVGDPFNMLLQYGLSSKVSNRRMSLEQMRDILTEHILDQEMLASSTVLSPQLGFTRSILRSRTRPISRPAARSVDDDQTFVSVNNDSLDIMNCDFNKKRTSGEKTKVSCRLGLDDSTPHKPPRSYVLAEYNSDDTLLKQPLNDHNGVVKYQQSEKEFHEDSFKLEPTHTDQSTKRLTELPVGRMPTPPNGLFLSDTSLSSGDVEETVVKSPGVVVPVSDLSDLTFIIHREQNQQSTPRNPISASDRPSTPNKLGHDVQLTTVKEPSTATDDCNFEFIRNPVKKAFFEGNCLSSDSTFVSPRSVSSPRSKQQVTFSKQHEFLPSKTSDRAVVQSPEKAKNEEKQPPVKTTVNNESAVSVTQPWISKEADTNQFALKLREETEELLKPVKYKYDEKPIMKQIGCSWVPPRSNTKDVVPMGIANQKTWSYGKSALKYENQFSQYSSENVMNRPKLTTLDNGINATKTKISEGGYRVRNSPKRNPTCGVSLKELTSLSNLRSTPTTAINSIDQLLPDKSDSTSTLLSSQSHVSGEAAAAGSLFVMNKSFTSSGQSSGRQDAINKRSIYSAANSQNNDCSMSWTKVLRSNVKKTNTYQKPVDNCRNTNVHLPNQVKSTYVEPFTAWKRLTQFVGREDSRPGRTMQSEVNFPAQSASSIVPIKSFGICKEERQMLAYGKSQVKSPKMGLNDIYSSKTQSPRSDNEYSETTPSRTVIVDLPHFDKSSGSVASDTQLWGKNQSSPRAEPMETRFPKNVSPRVGLYYPHYSKIPSPRSVNTSVKYSNATRFSRAGLFNTRFTKTQSKKISALTAFWGGSSQLPVIDSLHDSLPGTSSRLFGHPKNQSCNGSLKSAAVASQCGIVIGKHLTDFNSRMLLEAHQECGTFPRRSIRQSSVKPASHSGPGFHTRSISSVIANNSSQLSSSDPDEKYRSTPHMNGANYLVPIQSRVLANAGQKEEFSGFDGMHRFRSDPILKSDNMKSSSIVSGNSPKSSLNSPRRRKASLLGTDSDSSPTRRSLCAHDSAHVFDGIDIQGKVNAFQSLVEQRRRQQFILTLKSKKCDGLELSEMESTLLGTSPLNIVDRTTCGSDINKLFMPAYCSPEKAARSPRDDNITETFENKAKRLEAKMLASGMLNLPVNGSGTWPAPPPEQLFTIPERQSSSSTGASFVQGYHPISKTVLEGVVLITEQQPTLTKTHSKISVSSRYRSVASNTDDPLKQDYALPIENVSPMGSASTFQSSSEIKEFYYDDVLGNSFDTSLDRQHLSLQTPVLDVLSSSSSMGSHINGDQVMASMKTDVSHVSRATKGRGIKAGVVRLSGVERSSASASDCRLHKSMDDSELSTASKFSDAIEVTKRIFNNHEEGYASSVTVESDSKGCHTITCNKTELATGNRSTIYHATVQAPHVVTRVIVDDNEFATRPSSPARL